MTKGPIPLQTLLYSAVTEYKLLDEIILDDIGFTIFVARLDFVIYIFIEDKLGLHCVEFFESAAEANERKSYWKNRLCSGLYNVQTFSIPPNSLKFHNRRLLPKKENACTS